VMYSSAVSLHRVNLLFTLRIVRLPERRPWRSQLAIILFDGERRGVIERRVVGTRVPAKVRHLVPIHVEVYGVWGDALHSAQRNIEIACKEDALLQREVFAGQVDGGDAADFLARRVVDRRAYERPRGLLSSPFQALLGVR